MREDESAGSAPHPPEAPGVSPRPHDAAPRPAAASPAGDRIGAQLVEEADGKLALFYGPI
jgi:hypothetical protein